MNNQDTPETDTLRQKLRGKGWSDSYMIMMSHANKMERERDQALADAEKAKAYKRVMKTENDRLRKLVEKLRETLQFVANDKIANAADMRYRAARALEFRPDNETSDGTAGDGTKNL